MPQLDQQEGRLPLTAARAMTGTPSAISKASRGVFHAGQLFPVPIGGCPPHHGVSADFRFGGQVLLNLAVAVLLLLLAMPVWASPALRPNIVLILADDLGAGDLGVTGNHHIRTPNLDRLAGEGAQLDGHHASAAVCTPSRAGLLTGRYPVRTGMAVGVTYPHSIAGLPQSEITIATQLRAAGYRTAMLGKWHIGSTRESWPTAHGFERFWGVPWSNDMTPLPLYRNLTRLEEPLAQERFADRLVDEARAVIAEPSNRPFFLYVAHIAPHIPLRPGPRFRGKSRAGLYGDFVEEMDWTVGEILKAVQAAGKDRHTIILFTSDNGPWFEGSAGVHRGRKGDSFSGSTAAPLLARWPGHIPAGVRHDAIAMNIDLAPTLAGLAGTTMPTDRPIDGKDIFPLLKGERKSPHEALLHFVNEQPAAIRTQRWRLVSRAWYMSYFAPLDRFGAELLFDMAEDPGETRNLADRHPDIVADLRTRLKAAEAEHAKTPQLRTDPFNRGPTILPDAQGTAAGGRNMKP
jgi:arylsulfatase A